MGDINDLLYAYSLGCLDSDDYQELINFLNNGEEFNPQDLGEYQNLVSLLPSILPIEIPDPQLKDNVARKLYSLKDVIPSKRIKNDPSVENEENLSMPIKEVGNSKLDNPQDHIDEPIISDVSNVYSSIKESEFPKDNYDIEKTVETSGNLIDEKKDSLYNYPPFPIKKKNSFVFVGILLVILLIAGIIFTYFSFSSETNMLNNQVVTLKNEVSHLNNRIINNQEIKELLQSPNVQVINLRGTNLNPNGSGKILFDSTKGEVYLQISQIPIIPEDKTYQLWASKSGKLINLGILIILENMRLHSSKLQGLAKDDDVNFFITEEGPNESVTPSNKVYLSGTLTF
jgi:hypothetical protein